MTASKDAPDLGALYLRHRGAMFKVAASVLREVGRASDAADAVQDAMVSIMVSPPTDVANWEAFLVTAAKRKALDRVRSAHVRHSGPELDADAHDQAEISDFTDEVDTAIDLQREAANVWDCLSVLDERHRKAVWDTVALKRPRADVAAEMGVTPGRVSQLRTRSLVLLGEELRRREGNHE